MVGYSHAAGPQAIPAATHHTLSIVYPKHSSNTRIHGVFASSLNTVSEENQCVPTHVRKSRSISWRSTHSPFFTVMFEEIIDEFSFNHPANKGYGKSKKLRQLSSGDPQYTTGKCSCTLIYQRNLTRLKSKGSSIKAGNIRRNQDQRFKEYLW